MDRVNEIIQERQKLDVAVADPPQQEEPPLTGVTRQGKSFSQAKAPIASPSQYSQSSSLVNPVEDLTPWVSR